MSNLSTYFNNMAKLFIAFIKWTAIAIITGLVIGTVGSLFHLGVDGATMIREKYSWIIFFLPFAGLLIVFLYKILGMSDDKGTNSILLAVRTEQKLSPKMALLIFVTSIITHLFGGSSGREGAALQIGGSLASKFGRIIKLDEYDVTIITMCGMSAGFGALFGTPLCSAIFSLEVVSVGIMHYSAIVPCIISALTGAYVARMFGLSPTSFTVTSFPEASILSVFQVILLAILSAMVSILFCVIMRKTKNLLNTYFKSQYLKIFIAGSIIVLLTFIIGTNDYNGVGTNVIANAFSSNSNPEAFILKILFTAITLSAGYKGGEIVPVLFIGATFGNVMAGIIGLNPSFGAAIGLIALFCGVTNCPIASIFLAIELFGANGLEFYAITAAVSYILSGYEGLYSEQKILYSKLKPEFIDKVIGKK